MAKTVLVADDSPGAVQALSSAFSEAGFEVASAADGEEVFRRLADATPAALLVDLFVPKLNGADVCRVVKAHPHWKRTFLVLMASRIEDADSEMYRKLGADEVLRKPLDAPAVVALVSKALAD